MASATVAQPVVARVITAHDALQLGNSPTMSVSRSVLASCAARSACVRQRGAAELLRDGAGDGAHALHALALRAELVVIDHLARPATRDSSVFLRSWSKKNFASARRGRTTRSLPPITALASEGRDVADDQEAVGQLALGVQQREILLVGLHRQDQALLRHREKFRLEAAGTSTFGRSTSAVTSSSSASSSIAWAPPPPRRGLQAGADDLGAPRFKTGDHRAVFFQRGGIAVGVIGSPTGQRCFEAVALRRVAGLQAERLMGTTCRRHAAPPAMGRVARNFTSLQPSASW
jgi:hypothetical protein